MARFTPVPAQPQCHKKRRTFGNKVFETFSLLDHRANLEKRPEVSFC